jgi:hypothetical protein
MPFEEFETHTRENAPPMATLTYMPAHRKSAKVDAKPKLTIAIPTVLCGVSKCARFKILVGTGADAGTLRLVGLKGSIAEKGPGVKPAEHEHFLKWNFGYVPAWSGDKIEADKHPVKKIDDDTFDITVPKSWCEHE